MPSFTFAQPLLLFLFNPLALLQLQFYLVLVSPPIFHILSTALLKFDKMPSKGITVYSYVSVPGYEIEFNVPRKSVRNTTADNFTSKDLEVESSNIEGVGKYTGRFEWKAFDSDGNVVGSRFNNINSLTGNLEGGSMTSTVRFSLSRHDSQMLTSEASRPSLPQSSPTL